MIEFLGCTIIRKKRLIELRESLDNCQESLKNCRELLLELDNESLMRVVEQQKDFEMCLIRQLDYYKQKYAYACVKLNKREATKDKIRLAIEDILNKV